MKLIIVTIYVIGVIVAAMLCDMVIQANFSRMTGYNYDRRQMSSQACIYAIGSWLAAAYIWKTEKSAIKYTWKKWTRQL